MISDSEYIERIVKGIHALNNPDATVDWNVQIEGRQFDVVMKFTKGAYRFLVLIEVKDWTKSISAEQIEAFITKANDKLANKIVFVTKSGYQSGAISVAKRHGVDLFQLRFKPGNLAKDGRSFLLLKKMPDGSMKSLGVRTARDNPEQRLSLGDPTPINAIEECLLNYADGTQIALPNESSQMQYYVEKTKMSDGRSLDDVIGEILKEDSFGRPTKKEYRFTKQTQLSPPDSYFIKSGIIESISIEYTTTSGTPIYGNTSIEPTSIAPIAEYENAITSERIETDVSVLPVGEELPEPGQFYFSYHPLRYFYCESFENNIVGLVLVESFQSGHLFRLRAKQDVKYFWQYIKVTDKTILKRLEGRLTDFNNLPR